MEGNKDVIIGIDFGTSGIGFAYGFLDDRSNKIYTGHFNGQGVNNKIPAEIILDNDFKNVLAFGNECDSYIASNNSNTYQHFKKIKMNLYNKTYKIKSNNQLKEVDIEYIIRLMLIEIKKKAFEEIKKIKPLLNNENCKYVITVPAIWDFKSKQIMIDAAKNSGLFNEGDNEGTFFALEPEAASIYYNSDYVSYETTINLGLPFILCDMGSGTVDIIVQQKIKSENEIQFEELYPPTGGNDGSNRINELFIEKVIFKLFGKKSYDSMKKDFEKIYDDWIKFEKEIEHFKTTYQGQKNSFYSINCEIFQDYCNVNIDKIIKEYNETCPENWKIKKKRRWIIDFPYYIIDDLMNEVLENVLGYIRKIKNSFNNKLKLFIFTGGASLSGAMVNKIQKIDEITLNYVKSPNPESAISIGSVKYAFNRNIISIRKAKYTIGMGQSDFWEEKYEGKGKKIIVNGNLLCDNLFCKFITKGEKIPVNKINKQYFFLDGPFMYIDLYRTEEENIIFFDEKNNNGELKAIKFGELFLEVENYDPNNNEIIVEMRFGGTFVSVCVKYVKNNQKIKSLFAYQ